MIICIYGGQGSGKTLFLVKKGFEAHKQGRKVYSNFALNYPHEIIDFEDLVECNLNKAVVLLDEAHIWGLDARSSMSKVNKKLVGGFIPQVRKQGVDLFATSQFPRQLDVRLRENSDYAFHMKKYLYDRKNKKLVDVTQSQQFSAEDIMLVEVAFMRNEDGKDGVFRFIANDFYKLYDTKEVVKLLDDDVDNWSRKKKIQEKDGGHEPLIFEDC